MAVDYLGYVVAAVVAAGGIFGFIKAGSVPSLIAGLVFGGLLGYGAYLTSQSPPKPLLQLCMAIILAAFMGFRWAKSGNFMPPGLICAISAATVIYNLVMYNKHLFPSENRAD